MKKISYEETIKMLKELPVSHRGECEVVELSFGPSGVWKQEKSIKRGSEKHE